LSFILTQDCRVQKFYQLVKFSDKNTRNTHASPDVAPRQNPCADAENRKNVAISARYDQEKADTPIPDAHNFLRRNTRPPRQKFFRAHCP
jgi:hypothetical protein